MSDDLFYQWKNKIFDIVKEIVGKRVFELDEIPKISYRKYFDNDITSYETAIKIIIETNEFMEEKCDKPFVVPTDDTIYYFKIDK